MSILSNLVKGVTGAVSPVLGALTSGVLGMVGAQRQNKANARQVADQNAFNAEEAAINRDWQSDQAQRQMDFQASQATQAMDFTRGMANTAMGFSERMANTQWQRATADMRAAGINPMLAYQQGGAAAPIGATGSGVAQSGASGSGATAQGGRAHMENVLGPAVASALQGATTVANLEQLSALTDRTRAETISEEARARNIDINSGLAAAEARISKGIRPEVLESEIGQRRAQTRQALSSSALMSQQTETERYRPVALFAEAQRDTARANLDRLEEWMNRTYGRGRIGNEAAGVSQIIDQLRRSLGLPSGGGEGPPRNSPMPTR